jgi:hypothetical protein
MRRLTTSTHGLKLLGASVLAAVAALCGPAAVAAPQDLSNRYRLEARFDPADGALAVEGTMVIVADRRTESIELLLNAGVDVRRFTYGQGRQAQVEKSITLQGHPLPRTQRLRLPLERPLEKGERLEIRFAYDGRLTTEDIEIGRGVVSPRWTEMTFEALWYPVWLEEPIVRSEVTLITPERYQVVGPGRTQRLGKGRWRLDPGTPISGRITFALSDSWVTARRPLGGKLSAALHTVKPEPRAESILEAVGGAYGLLRGAVRGAAHAEVGLHPALRQRRRGAEVPEPGLFHGRGFHRHGQLEPQLQQDTLHHEVAHLWWSAGRPGTPDEFMSESVSEYLSIRRGEQVWGADWLKERRAKLAERSAKIEASLLNIDGVSPTRQPLLYDRGPAVPVGAARAHRRCGHGPAAARGLRRAGGDAGRLRAAAGSAAGRGGGGRVQGRALADGVRGLRCPSRRRG